MRFDRPISYNGWTSGLTPRAGGLPSSGTLVESVEPARVNAVGYLDKRAIQDGLDASDIYLGGRDFKAIVTVFGSTWGDFWDKAQDLHAAFSPILAYNADSINRGFLPFDFIQPTADISTWPLSTYPYGIPMRYYLRPSAPPLFTLRRDEVGGDETQGLSHRFELNLVGRDPRKYSQTLSTVANVTTTPTAITYRGDYSVWPAINFTLGAAGATNLTYTIDGQSVVINMSAHTTGTFVLDYAERTLTKDGVLYSGLITSGTFVEARPGTVISRANATGLSTDSFIYRESWA